MIGSGMPMSQSNKPRPKPMMSSCVGRVLTANPRSGSMYNSHFVRDAPPPRPALFGGLFPRGGVGFWLSLELELGQILALALAVAEQLILAGAVLHRTGDVLGAVPGRCLHRE